MNRIHKVLFGVVFSLLAVTPSLLLVVMPNNTQYAAMSETVTIETIEVAETEIEVETDIPVEVTEESTEEVTEYIEIETTEETIAPIETEPVIEETTVVETAEIDIPVIEPVETIFDPITIDPSLKVDKDDERSMIAAVIFQEMGGDYGCDDCRRRVADTILNRVASPYFPDTIYEVLTQGKLQYGFDSTTGVYWQERCKEPGEAHAVERAYRIAEEVLNGQHSEIYGKDYIWQAEFIQGVNNIYCCNTYFGQRDANKEW